jgi:peptidoglycan/LPS O-acetylase OafA/YrhL
MEFGFGMFSIIYRREIFTSRAFNLLFLVTMSFGVVARIVSLFLEGHPFSIFYFFLASELAGVICIYAYSRRTLEKA